MKKLANKTFRWYLNQRMRKIAQTLVAPHLAQENILFEALKEAEYTEYGRQHHFSETHTIEDYQLNVPLVCYEDVHPFIERMMHGEKNVLWPGVVQWFSKSSGTTNDRSKYIPVPKGNLMKCHIKGTLDAMTFLYSNMSEAAVFEGKNIVMGGSFESFAPHPQTKIGDVSALMLHHMPLVGRPFYSPDFETALLPNFEQKIAEMTKKLVNEDIRMIGGVPTWTLVLFRNILEHTGKDNILEVWPNLEAYIHGGVSFDPYKAQFRNFIPKKDFAYLEIYNASEGFFAAQNNLDEDGMLLLIDNGIFYEFIPLDEMNGPKPRTLTLSEVELDVVYSLVITTNAGLWRYAPGDTVVFTSLDPYKIKVAGRTQQFVNAFGEEVIVANTDRALAETCNECNAVVAEYTVAPIYFGSENKGGHQWLIEFEKSPMDMPAFNTTLDAKLQAINSDYEAKRFKSMALEELKLVSIPKGTFHSWMKKKGKYGGQNKVPRLANHRKYVDEILSMLENV